MITIIHGDDLAASRKYFLEQKKQDEFPLLNGESLSTTTLVEILEGNTLFSDKKSVYIENFFSKKKGKEFDAIISYLKKSGDLGDIFFWEGSLLQKRHLDIFAKKKIKEFKLPQAIFLFLDSIKPGNAKQLITLFHSVSQQKETEFLFYMLIRQFRLLLALSDSKAEQIDEVKRLTPWQMQKLQRQCSLFMPSNLVIHYQTLAQIDLAQKTGKLSTTLVQTIDFFLLNL